MYFQRDFFNDLKSSDPFQSIMQLEGKIYRQVKGRKTIRFVLNNKPYYVKSFYGTSIWEIIKNLLKGQMAVVDVSHERQALEKLSALGITAPRVVAYGNDQAVPLLRRSFIVMEAIEPSISLEDYVLDWKNKPLRMRRALIRQVAEIASKVQEQGISHRDFYICHFLLKTPNGVQQLDPENLAIALIDWHRARFQRPLPQSWLIKDLSALYFSVMAVPLTFRDYLRFLRHYTHKPLREVLPDPIWKKIQKRGEKLYKKIYTQSV